MIIDHFFIVVDPGAPQADLLLQLGLLEGPSNQHPGQGTANRRFFFANTMLEFLYVRDVNEATTGRAKGLRTAERVIGESASPFGLVLTATEDPFPGWAYCPEYFRDDQCFLVGTNSDLLVEPLCICMPRNLPKPKKQHQPRNSDWCLSKLKISVPVESPSEVLQAVSECENVEIVLSQSHHLELTFSENKEGKVHNMAPALPLTLRW